MKITLDLTESEWCELANAVSSKRLSILNGEYVDDTDNWEVEITQWAEELQALYEKIATALAENNVVY